MLRSYTGLNNVFHTIFPRFQYFIFKELLQVKFDTFSDKSLYGTESFDLYFGKYALLLHYLSMLLESFSCGRIFI